MVSFFDPFRQFTFLDVCLRLVLAVLSGGLIGYGRSKRNSVAGLRTYMLISFGAALSVIITLYEYRMLSTEWAGTVALVGEKFDASRLASQVVTGIGFLGAGMIMKSAHQQVRGLTTATGLFTTACMSIAAGAGYYECVLTVLVIIVLVLNVMTPLEVLFKRRLRNITLNVEMDDLGTVGLVSAAIEREKAHIYDVDIESADQPASAVFTLRLDRSNASHSGILSTVAALDGVRAVRELIS